MMVICPIVHPLMQQITLKTYQVQASQGAFEKAFKENFLAESFADLRFPKMKPLFYVALSS